MLTFLGIIVLVIVVHEMGHYLAARAMGVEVETFSVGFGKVLLKKKLFGTEWRLSLIPLGGYIKPKGEADYENKKKDPTSIWGVSRWKRAFIFFAGPLANLLLPWPLYFALIVGQPWPDVSAAPPGAEIARIGPVQAAHFSHKIAKKMYGDIWHAVKQVGKERPLTVKDIGGPVAVYEFSEQARKRTEQTGDWGFLVDWIAFLSINLGVINLFPIPVLDGGHIVLCGVEGIRRKNLSIKTRNVLNIIGAVLVLGLLLLAITSDVLRLAGI